MIFDIVMNMNKLITITSKGQTTLPIIMRRKLGIDSAGGVLQINFDERKGELVITKPASITDLSERISSFIKPGTKPVLSVDDYYKTNREMKT
jgi:bifunctional DNA-binding transcriptional regulator/antitoxin component of YhaV-PrlF toxin-antitoxin module